MAVLENGFPFDNVEYDATALGAWLSTRTRGVFSAEDHYAVTLAGSMQVNVSSGMAWLKMNEQWGMVAPNPAAISLAVDVGDTILNRIDVVCLRIDKNQSVQEVVVKKGSLAASPVYPALVRDLNYDEIFLAAISVPAGTTELNAGLLTDLRLDETYCGLMRDGVTGIPTAQLQAQAEALIASLQEAIDGVIDGSQYMLKTAYDSTNEVSEAGGIVPYVNSALANKANLSVVTGATPPATAPEDTIYVPEAFLVVSYSEYTPKRPSEGELWVPESNAVQVRGQLTRDTLLPVGNPKLYAGGNWGNVPGVKLFRDGTWQDFIPSIGFRVNRSTGAVEYTESAEGMQPASMGNVFNGGSWYNAWPFSEIRPCVLNNGVVQYYLDPDDYTKKIDGSDADITTGADGDVMIEFPLIFTKEWTSGGYDYVSLSAAPLDGYHANGFTNVNGVVQDTVYMAAYDGFNISSNLRSVSGKAPTTSETITTFRAWANARGAGYQQHQWSHRALLYNLFILMFKGLNSQALLGRGNVNTSAAKATGTMNDKGMYWGDQTSSNGVKFCGIENPWGNVWKFCDGLCVNSSNKIVYKPLAPYNNALTEYLDTGVVRGATGYVSQMTVGNGWGKVASQMSGDETTFYADNWWFDATAGTYVCRVGGAWTVASMAGLFAVLLDLTDSYSPARVGASLSYIPQ